MTETEINERLQKAIRAYLMRVINQSGLSAAQVAHRAGIAPTTITRPINNAASTHTLSTRTLHKIAAATNVPLPIELGGEPMSSSDDISPPIEPRLVQSMSRQSVPLSGPRDLPILGQVKTPNGVIYMDNAAPNNYVERPWFLLGNAAGYAIYVHDTCMQPALDIGQLLYIDPTRPVAHGDDCVVQMNNGEAYVKRFDNRDASAIVCRQFSPAKTITYNLADVHSLHLVVAVLKVRA